MPTIGRLQLTPCVQVTISARFQYFLRKRELHLLHRAYDLQYADVMKSSAVDAIKVTLSSSNSLWIVPQIFKLLPLRHIFFDLVIRFITNRKYAFFSIF